MRLVFAGGVYAVSISLSLAEKSQEIKQGAWRVLAAVGPNADAFGPPAATEFVLEKQILPSKSPVFSPTSSNRALYGYRNSIHTPGKNQSHFSSAKCLQRYSTAPVGIALLELRSGRRMAGE